MNISEIIRRWVLTILASSLICATVHAEEDILVLEPLVVYGSEDNTPSVDWGIDTSTESFSYDWSDPVLASAAGSSSTSTSQYSAQITGCQETSENSPINSGGYKGMRYNVNVPTATGIWVQLISITMGFANGDTRHGEFTEATRVVNGVPHFVNGPSSGHTFVDTNSVPMNVTSNGAALTGATYWITSAFIPGDGSIPTGAGFSTSGTATDSSSGMSISAGDLWVKAGYDTSLMSGAEGVTYRGFTVTSNNDGPVLKFLNKASCP